MCMLWQLWKERTRKMKERLEPCWGVYAAKRRRERRGKIGKKKQPGTGRLSLD